jgi:transposase
VSLIEADYQLLLRELAAKCKDAKERERLRALYAISIGKPIAEIMEIFCVDESTVHRWIVRWNEEKSLAERPRTGRPESLDEKDKAEMRKLVEENEPKKHGIKNASAWDTKELRAYFSRKERDVSRETLRRHLEAMGARYVKAELKYAEADEEKQREFAVEFFKNAELRPNSAIIFFQDECSVSCSARKGYGWTFEKRLVITAPQRGRKRMNCFGAVNPFRGEVIQMASSQAKAPALIRFLRKVERKHPNRKIWIYLDNLPVHKSAKVKKFLENHKRIELRFMPPYSPELNPQEQWWRHQRRKLLNNRSFRSTRQLASSLGWFVRQTPAKQVMSACSLEPLRSLLLR